MNDSMTRDPRTDPQSGDVLLERGSTHPIVIGRSKRISTGEIRVVYGDGNGYGWVTGLDKWRARVANSTVIYVNPEGVGPDA